MGFAKCSRPTICCPTRCSNVPDGQITELLSSPVCKNIPVFNYPKSLLELSPSHPTRGAYRDRHERGEGCGGRGSVLRATGLQGGLISL